jgi:glycosyltransferase involved in cell wall biosynthesis
MCRIALVYNFAQHYRLGIFKKLNDELDCDFYFGNNNDSKSLSVPSIDFGELSNYRGELLNLRFRDHFYWQHNIFRVFRKNYDVLIFLGEYRCLSTWFILLLSRLFTRRKVVLWSHGLYGDESLIKLCIKWCFFALADRTLLYGEFSKSLMINLGLNANSLFVINNSLNYDVMLQYRKDLLERKRSVSYVSDEICRLIFIGRLTKIKRVDIVIDLLARLNSNIVQYSLTIVGDGEEFVKLRKLVMDYNLGEQVNFMGAVYDDKVTGKLLFDSDLCISPGNVGLTAIHSLSYGTPVLTHSDYTKQMPEVECILPGKTGDLFEFDNVDNLYECVLNWKDRLKIHRDQVRLDCFSVIDERFNPQYQYSIVTKCLNSLV